MTLIPEQSAPLEDVWVALDTETTGLSFEDDEIIEIGAVKFQGQEVLDTYQAFVNPNRRLSEFIRRYTGITQAKVDGAPPFSRVAGGLASFVGSAPVVGHNVAFDLGFLERQGLKLPNPRSDTWDLAYVLHPGLSDYSLPKLAGWLDIDHARPHRAVDDALATKEVFLRLAVTLSELDVYTLAEMQRLAERSTWVLSYILRRMETHGVVYPHPNLPPLVTPSPLAERGSGGEVKDVDVTGLDVQALGERLQRERALRANQRARELDVDFVASLLKEGSPLSEAVPGFEERPEQVAMARAVAEAINQRTRLMVEAGTGVGKSLAYLLPALLYASMNNKRVVVSTNTINLQEQLLNKDVPALLEALADVDDDLVRDTKFTQLKGRANYLCLKRWRHLRNTETLADHDARLLAKTLMWLKTTATGDRSELNLGHPRAAAPWERLSAQGALGCPAKSGVCFLRAARGKAAASHLVIVNHALLLSDVIAGGSLIPRYDILVVDEAHHLEDEATRHLGFQLGQARFEDHLRSLSGERGLLSEAVAAFRGSSAAATRRTAVEKVAAGTTALLPGIRDNVAKLFATLGGLAGDGTEGGSNQGREQRITSSTRAQPGWSQLEIQWENLDLSLSELGKALGGLHIALDGLEDAGLISYEGLMIELARVEQVNVELRQMLAEFIPQPKPDGVYWVTRANRGGDLALHAAPLEVGETLDRLLFSQKETVVMTSATLSTKGSFKHIQGRTGFAEAEELLLGSPFDYPRAALLCVPEDMPEPTSWAYQAALEQAVTDSALALGGRTMALFTSHASLQATAAAVRGDLQARGIDVLAQRIDGSPQQLLGRFLENPESVLLGTASFWEGVDLAGEALKVLLVARLPFSVPSEPLFEARSELYENPFNEFAVPQAILRLRQGFGRLIRTKTDKGVVVVLDRRLLSRRYGKAFLHSLPPVSVETCGLHQLSDVIRKWVGA